MTRIAGVLLALAFVTAHGRAQPPADSAVVPSPCWKFAFGEWTPALNWTGAGHAGAADSTALAVRRIRDSVYARDLRATRTDAMSWERTSHGMLLLLFPAWWPAGVEVTFDSTLAGGREMLGTAVAMVANASRAASTARARAWQVSCGTTFGAVIPSESESLPRSVARGILRPNVPRVQDSSLRSE